jgi:hypothetical protein
MNAYNERRSDFENFGARITGFGVVVEKIWNFEVSGLFLWIFLRLGTLLGLFFKNQGSNCEIKDCGLILEKPRGFFAKLSGIIDSRIIFVRKKLWTQSTGTRSGLDPWWTDHGWRHRAHRRAVGTVLWLADAHQWQPKRGRGR